MIPMIEAEVVDKHEWIGREEFVDLVAVAQSLPGIFAVNISIFIGLKLCGMRGAVACAVGTVMPSFICILSIALFFRSFRDNVWVERAFMGVRPAVVALITAPVFRMARVAKLNRYTIWIPIASALAIWLLDFNPVWVIILAAFGGYLHGRLKQEIG